MIKRICALIVNIWKGIQTVWWAYRFWDENDDVIIERYEKDRKVSWFFAYSMSIVCCEKKDYIRAHQYIILALERSPKNVLAQKKHAYICYRAKCQKEGTDPNGKVDDKEK